ncbi:hypothetical protein YB2330_000001 [Saitoella coloradoensis]
MRLFSLRILTTLLALLALLPLLASTVDAATSTTTTSSSCTPLTIDDFDSAVQYSSTSQNDLAQWTSDDKTCTSVSVSNGVLNLTPKSGCYWYSGTGCVGVDKYSGVTFSITGPNGGGSTVMLEVQYFDSAALCAKGTGWKSVYHTVSGVSTTAKTFSVNFAEFQLGTGAVVSTIGFSGFSGTGAYKFGPMSFTCASSGTGTSAAALSSASVSRSATLVISTVHTSASTVPASSAGASARASSGSATASSAASTSPKPVSPDNTCGGTKGYVCPAGNYCSQYGWCGTTTDYSTNCQKEFSGAGVVCGTVTSAVAASSISASRTGSAVQSSATSVVHVTSSRAASSSSTTTSAAASGCPSALLIDDFSSDSRLTFLGYNSLTLASSDDGSMSSMSVSNNHVTLTPKSGGGSYFYTNFGCMDVRKWAGVQLTVSAAKGTTFVMELQTSSSCGNVANDYVNAEADSGKLGVIMDGKDHTIFIPWSMWTAGKANMDVSKTMSILFGSLSGPVTLGPIALYCGNGGTASATYSMPPASTHATPTSTGTITTATAKALVVDTFKNGAGSNDLGAWHGTDEGMSATYSSGKLVLSSSDVDLSFYTNFGPECYDLTSFAGGYLHVAYSLTAGATTDFSIGLQENNPSCSESVAPYPNTWDEVEASHYAVASSTANTYNAYIPLNHFDIVKTRSIGLQIGSFTDGKAVTFTRIELLPALPSSVKSIPAKIPTSPLIFSCTRPNSFAFAIDDGSPQYAQQVVDVVREAGIKVTFFTVGLPLDDASTNLTNVYKMMEAEGHQIALHSYTHPRMEALSDEGIEWELSNDIASVSRNLNLKTSQYFRPPFGTVGAKLRQHLASHNMKTIMWSVDVQDWIWAESDTPEKQLDAFQAAVDKGGNLVVMHYLYESTVDYLPKFIDMAKKTGKKLMRVDQCLGDPNAPPL